MGEMFREEGGEMESHTKQLYSILPCWDPTLSCIYLTHMLYYHTYHRTYPRETDKWRNGQAHEPD